MATPTIYVETSRVIDHVDPRIYSGFTEHMGRCIYGGIFDPENPNGLSDPVTGFRRDVLEALQEIKPPLLRYPGGNFVSTYRWEDGIGPKERRPRRPDLAWLTVEPNQFGTDEFMALCKAVGSEPFICLNMGTGTLEDALHWLEYCNGTGDTHYANLRRQNGHESPYNVKYWALGNEVWGPWQVGQMEARDYAKAAFQWAKALRLLDPSIKIISCGEMGTGEWDYIVLNKLAPVVDFHSIHFYTRSEGNHMVNVTSPAGPEKAIQITRSLIDLAKIENKLSKELTICFDEWNVWDPERAPGEKGAEESYDLSDALAVAAWLNIFVRHADVVKIACIAQSVNVISPITTSPTGLFKQTTYWPLLLFSNLMRGRSVGAHVTGIDKDLTYNGPTFPQFVQHLEVHTPDSSKLTKLIDVSAVIDKPEGSAHELLNVAIVNKSDTQDFDVPLRISGEAEVDPNAPVTVWEVWHEDLKAKNDFGDEKVTRRRIDLDAVPHVLHLKKHSFQIFSFKLKSA